MHIKKHVACIIALFLEMCILKTCALTRERLFVRDSQFDDHSCIPGDYVKTFDNIRSRMTCLASCMENEGRGVFYFPETNVCQCCYTFYSNDLQPTVSSETSFHYKPVIVTDCPGYVRHNNSCYSVTESKMTWDAAKDYCVSLNAHLAIIEDVEENSFIGTYLMSEGVGSTDGRVFFGLTDAQQEGDWLTVHGDIQSYFYWTPGEPNESSYSNQDCATINMNTTLKTWNDMPCSRELFAVCETELI